MAVLRVAALVQHAVFLSQDFYIGYGWYRRHSQLPGDDCGAMRVSLEFDGVFQEAEVSSTARTLGAQGWLHRVFAGYYGCRQAGGQFVAVRVNNNWDAAWRRVRVSMSSAGGFIAMFAS